MLILALCGCSSKTPVTDNAETSAVSESTVRHLTQEEAREIIASDESFLIVDVRRPDEFASGHIPGAVNIPNETIGSSMPELFKDRNQVLLLYCRSGVCSREAAQKLADLGYTNVCEFGGIINWTGPIEK